MDPHGTPAENSSLILHEVNKLLNDTYPFRKAKRESNRLALRMLPHLRKIIAESDEPLHTSCLISVAGNIIDMGILPYYDLEASLKGAMSAGFSKDHYAISKERLGEVKKIFYIADNSGEIAFDRLLLEQLRS